MPSFQLILGTLGLKRCHEKGVDSRLQVPRDLRTKRSPPCGPRHPVGSAHVLCSPLCSVVLSWASCLAFEQASHSPVSRPLLVLFQVAGKLFLQIPYDFCITFRPLLGGPLHSGLLWAQIHSKVKTMLSQQNNLSYLTQSKHLAV